MVSYENRGLPHPPCRLSQSIPNQNPKPPWPSSPHLRHRHRHNQGNIIQDRYHKPNQPTNQREPTYQPNRTCAAVLLCCCADISLYSKVAKMVHSGKGPAKVTFPKVGVEMQTRDKRGERREEKATTPENLPFPSFILYPCFLHSSHVRRLAHFRQCFNCFFRPVFRWFCSFFCFVYRRFPFIRRLVFGFRRVFQWVWNRRRNVVNRKRRRSPKHCNTAHG